MYNFHLHMYMPSFWFLHFYIGHILDILLLYIEHILDILLMCLCTTFICICTCTRAHTYTRTYIQHIHTHTHTHTHTLGVYDTCTYACARTLMRTHKHVRACVQACIGMHAYTHARIGMYREQERKFPRPACAWARAESTVLPVPTGVKRTL